MNPSGPVRPPSTSSSGPAPGSSGGRGRAVVLGGSLAGLLTAAALTGRFTEVTVVDRDPLDGRLEAPRRGVPQGRHTHGLLVGGLRAMEELLPGLTASLVARGGIEVDLVDRARWNLGGGSLARFPAGLIGMLASRTLIESEVRARVLALPGVGVLGGHDIVGLLASGDRRRVTGVRLTRRGADAEPPGAGAESLPTRATAEGRPEVELVGELVVDATGRGSRAPTWLAGLGYPPPPEVTVPADICYVTRLFRVTPGVLDDLDVDVIGSNPPDPRAGVALRQEGDRWTVTLAGMHGLQPPTELAAFAEYAAGLPTPGLAQVATGCEPIGEPQVYRYPNSRWRRWEKVSSRPDGLLVIGDAVASFNPVYGQGMSSAALQAKALSTLLTSGPHELPRRAAEAFAAVVAVPWTLATGGDRRYPGLQLKSPPERLLDRYLDRLLRVARVDEQVALRFFRVLNLLAAPTSLLAPAAVRRVLRPGAGGRPGGVAGRSPAASAAVG